MKFTEAQYLVVLNYLMQAASGVTIWRWDRAHAMKSNVFAVKAAALVRSGCTAAGDVLDPRDRNFFDAMPDGMQPEALYRR